MGKYYFDGFSLELKIHMTPEDINKFGESLLGWRRWRKVLHG